MGKLFETSFALLKNSIRVVQFRGRSSERASAQLPINLGRVPSTDPSGRRRMYFEKGLKKRSDSDRCEDGARCIFNRPFISR